MPRARGENYQESKFPRVKTKFDGVFYILGTDAKGREEKIYYISYYDADGVRHYERRGGRVRTI